MAGSVHGHSWHISLCIPAISFSASAIFISSCDIGQRPVDLLICRSDPRLNFLHFVSRKRLDTCSTLGTHQLTRIWSLRKQVRVVNLNHSLSLHFFLLIPQLMACKYTIFQNKTIRTPQQSQGVMGRISLLLRPKVQVRSVVQPPSADQWIQWIFCLWMGDCL